jgi:hypothetical protein
LPQGEGSVPNEVVVMEDPGDDAPVVVGDATTPVAASAETNSPSPTARTLVILFIIDPWSVHWNLCGSAPGHSWAQ